MKHPPALMLGLATLILSSASAYSLSAAAAEPLTFDPTPTDQPIAYAKASLAPASSSTNSSNAEPSRTIEAKSPSVPLQPSQPSQPSANLPNLPLFELPPFQAEANLSSQADQADQADKLDSDSPVSKSESDSGYSSLKPVASETPEEATPFQLPADLTDADLYESGSEQAIETDSLKPDTTSRTKAEIEFETEPEIESGIDISSSSDWSATDQLRSKNDDIERSSSSAPIVASELPKSSPNPQSIGLSFDPPRYTKSSTATDRSIPSPSPTESAASKPDAVAETDHSLDRLFKGDSDSLVAVAVGSAEGTRTPDGGKNPAYQGHTDPGNGVWNLGSFSYQHGASSPEEADAKQLARLHTQAQTILDKATAKGLDLTLEEKLNGIDLANQAPKAALDNYGSYIDWLADARASGLGGNDAILWARVHSFLDPYTQSWNAPGLGNSEERITSDQERRMLAIAKAIATYMQGISQSSVP